MNYVGIYEMHTKSSVTIHVIYDEYFQRNWDKQKYGKVIEIANLI